MDQTGTARPCSLPPITPPNVNIRPFRNPEVAATLTSLPANLPSLQSEKYKDEDPCSRTRRILGIPSTSTSPTQPSRLLTKSSFLPHPFIPSPPSPPKIEYVSPICTIEAPGADRQGQLRCRLWEENDCLARVAKRRMSGRL